MTLRASRRPHVVPITAPSFPTGPRTHVYRNIAYSFIAFTVVVLLAVLWLSSARATVVLTTKRTPVTFEGTIDISPTPQQGQLLGSVQHETFTKIQEFPATGSVSSTVATPVTPVTPAPTPATPVQARGTVRIINTYSRAQPLVRTTRLLTADGKLYRIQKDVNVPAGGEVTVEVLADKQGAEFAIAPTRFTIPGLFADLQPLIYAQSDAAFTAQPVTSGSAAATPTPTPTKPTVSTFVTQADIDKARSAFEEAALAQAKANLVPDASLRNPDVTYILQPIEPFKTSVLVGQNAATFIASAKYDVIAVFYPKEDMQAYVRTKLKEKIPEGRDLLLPADGSSGVTIEVKKADPTTNSASMNVQAQGDYRFTPSNVGPQKASIAGRSETEAEEILRAMEGIEDADVQISPSWYRKVPSLRDRIDIQVK